MIACELKDATAMRSQPPGGGAVLPKNRRASPAHQVGTDEGESVRRELEGLLRSVYDDDDFVYCTIACAETPENWGEMLRFAAKAEEMGDEVTHDDLVALSLVLERKLLDAP